MKEPRKQYRKEKGIPEPKNMGNFPTHQEDKAYIEWLEYHHPTPTDHKELEERARELFESGENWGVTHSTWFEPTKEQKEKEFKEAYAQFAHRIDVEKLAEEIWKNLCKEYVSIDEFDLENIKETIKEHLK